MGRDGRRIDALDALRGFAIFGILLINIQVFSGYGFVGHEARSALAWGAWDEELGTILDVLVRAKFYSLFSLLFGYSFVLLARKAAEGAVRLHLRRMAGLVAIGLVHSLLLWPWDILLLYGLVGLLLAPLLQRSASTLASWGACLLVIVGLANWFGPALGLPAGRGELAVRVLQQNVPALAGGSYLDVVRANLYLTGSVFVEWSQDLRPLRVLAMFLLGAAAAMLRLAERDSAHRALVHGAAVLGLLIGLALSLTETLLEPDSTPQRAAFIFADAAAAPVLAIGYAAVLVLWWQRDGLLGTATRAALAPVGRMALTNYLMQSLVCVPVFYGFGAGWFAEVSLAQLMLFAGGLFASQVIFSVVWLLGFRQGPIEWLWRWQIKGQRPPLLNSSQA